MADRLKPKHNLFIKHYTDIDNPHTFGNGTQSYLKAYKTCQESTAGVNSSKLLKDTRIRNAIDEQLRSLHFDRTVRLQHVINIAKGEYIKKSIQKHYDADGSLVHTTETSSGVGAEASLKALDMLNKLSGDYEKAKTAERLRARELNKLHQRILGSLKDVTPSEHDSPSLIELGQPIAGPYGEDVRSTSIITVSRGGTDGGNPIEYPPSNTSEGFLLTPLPASYFGKLGAPHSI